MSNYAEETNALNQKLDTALQDFNKNVYYTDLKCYESDSEREEIEERLGEVETQESPDGY